MLIATEETVDLVRYIVGKSGSDNCIVSASADNNEICMGAVGL
jgi:hypothetical protein